jgi:small subunit ribosomal protein S6
MRKYELTYIIHPDIIGDEMSAVMEQVEGWVKAGDGAVQKISDWGRRRLAYPIDNQREGHYIHLEVDLEPAEIYEVERNLKLSEQILRHLLVRAEDGED